MKWFNQLWYDIKRLAGHGSLPVLVLLAPFIITGIFSTIFFPLLSEAHGANIPFAVCNDDHSEMIDVFFQYNMGKKNDIATYYPVQDMETGMKLLKEERISVLLHIPSDFYQLVDAGEDSPIYLYYLPSHEFEATMIQINLNNNLAYVGQSQNILSLAADVADEHGFTPDVTYDFLNFCIDESIRSYSRRSAIFEKNGAMSAIGDYMPAEYYAAALFSLCLLFAMFPTIHLTADDLETYYKIRKISGNKWMIDYSVRLVSGALLNALTLFMFIPVTYLFKKLNGSSISIMRESLSHLILCIPVLAVTFSALAIMIAVISKNTNTALWTGLYLSFFMIACSGLFTGIRMLSSKLQMLLQILPFHASMSLISNALYKLNKSIYYQNIGYLTITCIVCITLGMLLYRRKTKVVFGG
ncbi:MAG: ABC transporter permease [Lachnospiraceae bacterium]|nr:ABC transporter permease [Lachnospiraceae bacterium]